MDERDIQLALYWSKRPNARMIMPNYTPDHWFECDLYLVTAAGYAHEYEIKLTRSDYTQDRKKAMKPWATNDIDRQTKHDLLAKGDRRGPSMFWFVAPHGLIAEEETPEWAGLIWIRRRGLNLSVEATKRARRLHEQKVDPRVVEHAKSVCYYRYWEEIRRLKVSRDDLRRTRKMYSVGA